jgi:four helix bundle suffix protein
MDEPIIATHGGYRSLKSFQVAQLVYDVTVLFCRSYVPLKSRTHDQMVQAARSGVQNIAEGSQAAGTSRSTELKLTNVARASLEELKLDYEDFLRQNNLPVWPDDDPRCSSLIAARPARATNVGVWARSLRREDGNVAGFPEITANAALTLIRVACSLLGRQIRAQAAAFETDGGFNERLYHARQNARRNRTNDKGQ